MKQVFQANGFPLYRVKHAIRRKRNERSRSDEERNEEKEKKKTLFCLCERISEKIISLCRNIGVRTAFTSKSTLRNLLTHVKPKIPPENRVGVIYLIPCECGAVYSGETGRNIKIRLQEHIRTVNKGDENNAIACHQMTTGHNIKWEDSRVLEQESNLQRRKIKETIYIRTTANTMNTDRPWTASKSNVDPR